MLINLLKKISLLPLIILSQLIGLIFLDGILAIFVTNENIHSYQLVKMLLTYIFVFFILLFYNKYILKEKLDYIWLRFSIKHFLMGYLKGILITTLIFMITIFTGNVSFNGINNSFIILSILFFIGFIFQASCEELIIRGFVTRWIYHRFGKLLSVIMPSILFSALHLSNPSFNFFGFLNTILVGILFAQDMFKTNTIDYPSGFHSSWNFFISIIFGFNVSGIKTDSLFKFTYQNSPILGNGYGPEGSYIITIIILILIIINLYKKNLIKKY